MPGYSALAGAKDTTLPDLSDAITLDKIFIDKRERENIIKSQSE